MKLKVIKNTSPASQLSDAYLAALQARFHHGQLAGSRAAEEIGRESVAIGLETLDLARIHHQALAQLLATDGDASTREKLTACAAGFFIEAITPIEETHRIALKANSDLQQLHALLDERMVKLAETNRELQRQVAERTTVETALRNSQQTSSQLLRDSLIQEKHLRAMAHQIISATEEERHKMSLQLNNVIAQTLLGINLHILALNKDVATNQAKHAQEIADTQRLVEDSTHMIRRLTHEFSNQHE